MTLSKMRAALYARVSKTDQQTIPMQLEAMRDLCRARGWQIAFEFEEKVSTRKRQPEREKVLELARRGKVDVILSWKLDRFGRSTVDLISTIHDLMSFNVGFVSITEAFDLTTPIGKAFFRFLAVLAEFERDQMSERIRAGIAASRRRGTVHGRPALTPFTIEQIEKLVAEKKADGKRKYNNAEIARRLNISRPSVVKQLKLLVP